jgi:hypothetical protein
LFADAFFPMKHPFSTDFFDSLAFQIMRSQRLGLPHITRALVFQGMDAMAFVSGDRDKLGKAPFVRWTEKYLSFSGELKVTGEEFFKARQKHLPALKKRVKLRGTGRMLVFVDATDAPNIAPSSEHTHRLSVRTDAFADAFLEGMMQFMHDLKGDEVFSKYVVARFEKLPFAWKAATSVLADEMRRRELAIEKMQADGTHSG